MDYNDVAKAIINGEFDNELADLKETIDRRKESLAALKFIAFRPGDKVKFNSTVRPAYLAGRTGTLIALRRKKVTVDLDTPAGRFFKGVNTPVALIEKI